MTMSWILRARGKEGGGAGGAQGFEVRGSRSDDNVLDPARAGRGGKKDSRGGEGEGRKVSGIRRARGREGGGAGGAQGFEVRGSRSDDNVLDAGSAGKGGGRGRGGTRIRSEG